MKISEIADKYYDYASALRECNLYDYNYHVLFKMRDLEKKAEKMGYTLRYDEKIGLVIYSKID